MIRVEGIWQGVRRSPIPSQAVNIGLYSRDSMTFVHQLQAAFSTFKQSAFGVLDRH